MAHQLTVSPFEVRLVSADVDDLRQRLAAARWPHQPDASGWRYGTDIEQLRPLCEYWRNEFSFAGMTERLNRFPQYRAELGGRRIHFYHVRSRHPDAVPLLLSHGWPGASAEFLDIIGPLTDPEAFGGSPDDAFHVVAPSLPGFGFSGEVAEGYRSRDAAADFAALMQVLGYERYFAHGGDKGTRITMTLAARHPDRLDAIHLGLMPAQPPDPDNPTAGLTPDDVARLERTQRFRRDEMAYQALQRTKPQSLAYGLTDSPVGLAAWLLEKFHGWTDCREDELSGVPTDRLLDIISIYWFTGTIASSMRSYFEDAGPGREEPLPEVRVPAGHTLFPAEIMHTPRLWAERTFDLRYWREAPSGGHFPAMEVPDVLVGELRDCFRPYR